MDKFTQAIDKVNKPIAQMQWDIDRIQRRAKRQTVLLIAIAVIAIVEVLIAFNL